MSKFLKFIVGIVLALFIVSGAALLIPSYIGYNTTIVDSATTGNQKTGTVIYTQQKPVSELANGDKILELRGDSVNVRTVKSYDKDAETIAYDDGAEGTLQASGDYYLVKLAVPALGYLSIAMQSRNGLIFLGLILLLVIFLFILSEVLRHHAESMDDYDAYDEEDDDEYFENLAATHQLNIEKSREETDKKKKDAKAGEDGKKEKKPERDRKERKAERKRDRRDRKDRRKETASDRRERRPGADDEAWTDQIDAGPIPESEDLAENIEAELKRAEEISEEEKTDSRSEAAAVQKPVHEEAAAQKTEEGNIPDKADRKTKENRDEVQIAMPARTAEELLQKAYQEGLDPKVHEDEITGVTLIDYSDSI